MSLNDLYITDNDIMMIQRLELERKLDMKEYVDA